MPQKPAATLQCEKAANQQPLANQSDKDEAMLATVIIAAAERMVVCCFSSHWVWEVKSFGSGNFGSGNMKHSIAYFRTHRMGFFKFPAECSL